MFFEFDDELFSDSEDMKSIDIKNLLMEIDFTEFSQKTIHKEITKSKYNYLIPNELKIEMCKQLKTTSLLLIY